MASLPYLKILELNTDVFKNKLENRFMREIFEDEIYKRARPEFTVVDLGAFEGEFSFYCLPFAKDIYAVEPDPRAFGELQKMVVEHKLGETLKIFDCAIAGENGNRSMSFTGYGGNSFGGNGGIVKAYTLNTFLNDNKIEKVDILKIDVELAEIEIFNAKDFPQAADKINFIIGENHSSEDSVAVLKNYGFTITYPGNSVFIATK